MSNEETPEQRKRIVLDLDYEQIHPLPTPVEVLLLPSRCTVVVSPGESIYEAAKRAGIFIPSTCGGKGTCGRCRVIFALPARPPSYVERQFIDRADLARGIRLSCRSRPADPVTVTIPAEKRP